MTTLTTIGAVATAMGPVVEKASKVCVLGTSKICNSYMFAVVWKVEAFRCTVFCRVFYQMF